MNRRMERGRLMRYLFWWRLRNVLLCKRKWAFWDISWVGLVWRVTQLLAVHNWHAPDKVKALTRKGASFVWTDRQQTAYDALKACLISAPLLGFPTEDGRFLLDDREVVIAYASHSLRLSQRRNCTTCREMLVAVVMCTYFRSYLRGAQFILRTDHSSLRWLQKFHNEDGMLARWYLLLGQFSVTFEYRPGTQHAFPGVTVLVIADWQPVCGYV